MNFGTDTARRREIKARLQLIDDMLEDLKTAVLAQEKETQRPAECEEGKAWVKL